MTGNLQIDHRKYFNFFSLTTAVNLKVYRACFNEAYDSLDAYLKRFERFAENAAWDKSEWATN